MKDEIAARTPFRIVNSVAPTRIVDNGGWTDTWFARYGSVFNIAVAPYAEVQIQVFPRPGRRADHGLRGELRRAIQRCAADGRVGQAPAPRGSNRVHAGSPGPRDRHIDNLGSTGGASTGTSAAVTVALIGALDRLAGGTMRPHDVAYAAHHVEMEMVAFSAGYRTRSARRTEASTSSRWTGSPVPRCRR